MNKRDERKRVYAYVHRCRLYVLDIDAGHGHAVILAIGRKQLILHFLMRVSILYASNLQGKYFI